MNRPKLTEKAVEYAKVVRNNIDWDYYFEWFEPLLVGEKKRKWQRPCVSALTFIDHPDYLNAADKTFPAVKNICTFLTAGAFKEGILMAGIGAGKSFTSQIMINYETQKLLCMRDPHDFFRLAKDKDISIINMGPSAQQAKSVVFSGLANMMNDSKFFKTYGPEILKTEIRFPNNRILIVSGNSKETTPLGKNIYCAVLDEAAFFMDNENRSVAEAIHAQLHERISSRFREHGLIMMISSPRYEGDFIMKKLRESKETNERGERIHPEIYSFTAATWKTQTAYQDDEKYLDPEWHFWFDSKTNKIILPEEWEETKRMLCQEGVNYIRDAKQHTDCRFWQIPVTLQPDFLSNPEKAKRDFGAVPSMTMEGFFPNPVVIDEMSNPRHANPIKEDGTYEFPEPYQVPHYIHLDLALNKGGRGDFAGFTMCHIDSWQRDPVNGDLYPMIYVDLVERIGAGPSGEIEFEHIRQKIYDLQDFGFRIAMVTADGYQSTDMKQILKSRGIDTDYLSVDRTLEPYQMLKTMINMKRIDVYEYPTLVKELKELELVKGVKVDHPSSGGKDCIAGDTKIPLLDGQETTIRDLVGQEFYVYASGESGDVHIAKAYNVHKVGDLPVMRIWLDNDEFLECTPDHEIMLRDGSFIEAKDLKEGDSLMPLYRKKSTGNAKHSLNGYEMFQDNATGKYKFTHQQVAKDVFDFEYGRNKEERMVIHHKDFSKLNNNPDNLQIMGWDEHRDYHNRVGTNNLKALWKDPEFRARCAARSSKLGKVTGPINITKYNKSPERIKKLKENGLFSDNGKKVMKQIWANPVTRASMIASRTGDKNYCARADITMERIVQVASRPEIYSVKLLFSELGLGCGGKTYYRRLRENNIKPKDFSDKYFCKKGIVNYKSAVTKEKILELAPHHKTIKSLREALGISQNTLKERQKQHGFNVHDYLAIRKNHKVTRVEHNVGVKDVYDMTVDTYHNFAIGPGIFIHNCADSLAGAVYSCIISNQRGFGVAY